MLRAIPWTPSRLRFPVYILKKKKLEEKGQKHKKRGGEREFGGVMAAYSNQVKLFQLCKEIRMINTLDEGSEKIFLQDVIWTSR